jgi:RHS repeat-associated protein
MATSNLKKINIGRRSVGHPVDVATGALFTAARDADIRGHIPLRFRRFYSTELLERQAGPLGWGWTSNFFLTLQRDLEGYHLFGEEGDVVTFDDSLTATRRGSLLNVSACMELAFVNGDAVITHWHHLSSKVIQYVFRDGFSNGISRLTAVRKMGRAELKLNYDRHGTLLEIVQTNDGRVLRFEYDDELRVKSLLLSGPTQFQSQLATYRYDADGNLLMVSDASGSTIRYEYDASHRLIAETDRAGMRYQMRFDQQGRCIETAGLENFVRRQLIYQPEIGITRVTDSRGTVTSFEYNEQGQILKETSPLGAVWITGYDGFGRVTSRVDPLGRSIELGYDDRGDLVSIQDESGGMYAIEFDSSHRPITHTEPSGNRWTWKYDELGLIQEVSNPGAIQRYTYAANGQSGSMTLPAGGVLEFEWAPGHDEFLIRSSIHQLRQSLDLFGRVNAIADPALGITRYAHSPEGCLIRTEFPDGGISHGKADALGRITSWRDASGRMIQINYDLRTGRPARITLPSSHLITFEYDSEGRLVKLTNQAGEDCAIDYNADGHVVAQRFFDGRTEVYTRDLAGQLLAVTCGGRKAEYCYNPSGLVTKRLYSDGSQEVFQYGPTGLLEQATNSCCSVQFEYDEQGRRVAEITEGRRVEYRYNAAGQLVRQHYVDGGMGPVDLAYDEFSRLKSISVGGSIAQRFRWDAHDRCLERNLFGKTVESFQYRAPGGAVARHVRAGNHALVSREYQRDMAGNLTEVLDQGQVSARFQYDADERVIAESLSEGPAESYSYDPAGNLLARGSRAAHDAGGNGVGYSNPSLDGAPVNGTTIRDEQGRVYQYDCADRLVSFTGLDGSTATYEYDAFGRRIRKIAGGLTTTFVWAGYDLVAESSAGSRREYVTFGFCPLAEWSDGQLFATITSPQYQPTELIDRVGHCVWSGKYNAFGELVSQTDTGYQTNLRAAGQYADRESGLFYNIKRYYDPEWARFTTPDPLGLAGGLNASTVAKNPLNWIDPLGLECGRTDIIHFAQKAVSAEFSSGGDHKGKTLDQAATELRANPKLADTYVVHYVVDPKTGEKLTVNNRSLTVLSMAGLEPTHTVDLTGHLPTTGPDTQAAINQRLAEIGDRGRTSIGIRPPGSTWDTPPDRTVHLLGFGGSQ